MTSVQLIREESSTTATRHFAAEERLKKKLEGWLSPVEGTRLEIERRVKPTVGSNPTPSTILEAGQQGITIL